MKVMILMFSYLVVGIAISAIINGILWVTHNPILSGRETLTIFIVWPSVIGGFLKEN